MNRTDTEADRLVALDFTSCFGAEPPAGQVEDDVARARADRKQRRRVAASVLGGTIGAATLILGVALASVASSGPTLVPADAPDPAPVTKSPADCEDEVSIFRSGPEAENTERVESKRSWICVSRSPKPERMVPGERVKVSGEKKSSGGKVSECAANWRTFAEGVAFLPAECFQEERGSTKSGRAKVGECVATWRLSPEPK